MIPRSSKLGSVVLLMCFFHARPCLAQQPLWGMSYGNRFSVETTVERTTKVSIGGSTERVHRSTETTIVQYSLAAMQQSEVALKAKVLSCRRSGDSPNAALDQLAGQQIGLCEGLQVYVNIDADGVVTGITPGGASGSRVLAGGTGENKDLMAACWNERVIGSWLGRPFWCSLPLEKWQAETSWEHTDEVSIGLLGQVRNIVSCTISKATDETAEVLISGNARHIPMPRQITSGSSLLQFEDISVSVDKFSGSAKMIQPKQTEQQDGPPAAPANQRPWFDSLSLDWQIRGEATIAVGDEKRTLVFSQDRTERSRLLPGYQMGRPQMVFPTQ